MADDKAVEATRGMSLVDAAARLQALYSPKEDTARPTQPTLPDVKFVDEEIVPTTTPSERPEEESGETAPEAAPTKQQDDDVESEETPQPKRYRVKANGAELEVTEDELLKGYSRTADYTRQKQQVTELEKAARAEAESAKAERARLASELQQVDQALKSLKPQEPNWEQLRATDPTAYAIAVADWNLYQSKVKEVESAKAVAESKVFADRQNEYQQFLTAEKQALTEKVPSWKDGKVANKELAEMVAYAKSHGYTDQELANIVDHRVLIMLRDAWKYDVSRKAKPVVQQLTEQKIAAVKSATPGQNAQPTRRGEREIKSLAERAMKTGNLRDTGALFNKLFEKKG